MVSTGNGDAIAIRSLPATASNDRAAASVADRKFAGEDRRIDQRRAAHEYGGNLETVFLKNSIFNGDKEWQRRAGDRRVSDR